MVKRKRKPDPLMLLIHALLTGFMAAAVQLGSIWPEYAAIFTVAVIVAAPVQGALRSWLGEEEQVRRIPPVEGSDR